MESRFDELSKALAQEMPRREALRRVGGLIAGAFLATLGLEQFAWGQGPYCQNLCAGLPPRKLKACRKACKQCARRIRNACFSGRNGTLKCCGPQESCCGQSQCCDLGRGWRCCEVREGGAITATCCEPERPDCCQTADGNPLCVDLHTDPDNCGRCGERCPDAKRTCCDGFCSDLDTDIFNCGRCGKACDEDQVCINGTCVENPCPPGTFACRNLKNIPGNPDMTCCADGVLCCDDGICWDHLSAATDFCCDGILLDGRRLVRGCDGAVFNSCCNVICCWADHACCRGACCPDWTPLCCEGNPYATCCPEPSLCCPSGQCFTPPLPGLPAPSVCCPLPANGSGDVLYFACSDEAPNCCIHQVIPNLYWCCPAGTHCHPTAYPYQCVSD